MCHCIFDIIISFFDNYSGPSSDFFITMCGFSISSLGAILSVVAFVLFVFSLSS